MNLQNYYPKVLVVGGSGGVGRFVSYEFVRNGWQVTCLSHRDTPKRLKQQLYNFGVSEFLRADIGNSSERNIADLVSSFGFQIVINAADVWRSDPGKIWHTNFELVRKLRLGCARSLTSVRLIHLGTLREHETTPAPYVQSKVAGTREIVTSQKKGDLDAVALRIANICGPEVSSRGFLSWVAEELAERCVKKRTDSQPLELTVASDWRDFIDIRDVSRAVFCVALESSLSNPIIEVGRGKAVPVRCVLDILLNYGQDSASPVKLMKSAQPPRETFVADPTSVKSLGWAPGVSLEQSISDMWRAALSQAGRSR